MYLVKVFFVMAGSFCGAQLPQPPLSAMADAKNVWREYNFKAYSKLKIIVDCPTKRETLGGGERVI